MGKKSSSLWEYILSKNLLEPIKKLFNQEISFSDNIIRGNFGYVSFSNDNSPNQYVKFNISGNNGNRNVKDVSKIIIILENILSNFGLLKK